MKKIKNVFLVLLLVLSPIVVGLPTYAEPEPDTTGGDTILVGDPDELVSGSNECDGDECGEKDSDFVALSSISLSPASVTVAKGGEQFVMVSFNDGFDVANIDEVNTYVEYPETDSSESMVASVYFDGEYTDDSYEEYKYNWNLINVYGIAPGTAVYTVIATDLDGNTATAELTVTVSNALGGGYDYVSDGSYGTLYEGGAIFGTPIEGGEGIAMTLVPMTTELQALSSNLTAVLDVSVVDENGDVIPVSNNDIELWFGVSKDTLGDLAEADNLYFQVAYIENGAIAQYFDTFDVEDDGWGWMFAVSGISHFSQYGILVSTTPFTNAADLNALLAPNTGVFTGGSNSTLSVTELLATVVVLSMVLVAYTVIKHSKRQ